MLKLKMIKEETIKPISVEEASEEVADMPEVEVDKEEIPQHIIENACQDLINNLTQEAWNFISSVNSSIATIEDGLKNEETKKEIIELLNTIVDDATINIGILHKVFSLINSNKADLIASGEEKAEDIIASDNSDTE